MQKRHDPFGHLRLQDSPLERTGVPQLGFEIMTRWRVIVVTFRIYLLLSVEASVSFNCTCSSLGQIIQSSMSPGMTPLPTAHGRGRGCPPRQSGSTAAEEACRTGTHTRRPCLPYPAMCRHSLPPLLPLLPLPSSLYLSGTCSGHDVD